MALFSERYDITPKKVIQTDSINDDLKSDLWNLIFCVYNEKKFELFKDQLSEEANENQFIIKIWTEFLKKPIQHCPNSLSIFLITIHSEYKNKWEWWKIYNFLEFLADNDYKSFRKSKFIKACNECLKSDLSAFRFVEGKITPITSNEEIEEVEKAFEFSSKPVNEHLQQALVHLSNKETPDYRNSIKESISAVESNSQTLCGNTSLTLGDALKALSLKGITIHPALKSAFSNLYGWTNTDSGIRHALQEDSHVDLEDAQFMLIACSAFINYLREKAKKASIDPQQ